MKLAATGRKQEVGGLRQALDSATRRSLNVVPDAARLSEAERGLLEEVGRDHDTEDVTPMNARYGPISGMSEGERVLRAYRMGLLRPRTTKETQAGRVAGAPGTAAAAGR
ncbi:MAG: hypothetical protein EOP01_10410 [Propionibacteriaceae bacterium]|nr:MAG: hypothetical protein EOP01_10410 [Propionibacteriaceae bacterium]